MMLLFRWTIAACLWLLLCSQAHASFKLFSNEHKQYMCMGTALWMESRGEPLKGQRAVWDVIHNRAAMQDKPVCDIVFAKGQFSWTKKTRLVSDKKWKELYRDVAKQRRVLDRQIMFFYNPKLAKPKWAANMRCQKIGNHKFCREKEKA